jgi:hypothetical protein
MKDRGGQLARDLEHVRQHQQETLRSGEGGGQRARLQRAVYRSRGATLALHLLHDRHIAPDVRHPFGSPLVGKLGHRR